MKHIEHLDTVPPGGWRYTQFETKQTIRAGSYKELVTAVIKHRKLNNIPIEQNLESLIQDQICKLMPPGVCVGYDPREVPQMQNMGSISWGEAYEGTRVLLSWVSNGTQVVPRDEAEERAAICAGCYYNVQATGCASCRDVAALLVAKLGRVHTSLDDRLRTCGICKCSNKAQVHIPMDDLHKGVTPEVNAQFPEFCWKKKQLT